MDFLKFLSKRGYLYQCTDIDGLSAHCRGGNVVAYIGFDCTAPSLHLGSLVQLMVLRAMQRYGLKPIVLLGGGTSKIGDPSGKTAARQLLEQQAIEDNMKGIKSVIEKFLDLENITFVDNADWFDGLGYLEFIRDFGRLFSVNHMLSYESVKSRLTNQQGLSFIEFNYPLLQAYDFCKLYELYGCTLQVGGSDQWGNITAGIDAAKKYNGARLYGLTTELITTSSGNKMGKTAEGAVWLDGDPYDYWQYFRNIDDKDVLKMLLLFTDLSLEEMREFASLKGGELNNAKKILATEATSITFGKEIAYKVSRALISEFEKGESDNLPLIEIQAVQGDLHLFELIKKVGIVNSFSESKQLIRSGAVKINNVVHTGLKDLIEEDQISIKVGKRRLLVKIKRIS